MNQHHGLCMSCKGDPACTYVRDPNRPVLQCEEFEGYGSSPSIRTLARRSLGPDHSADPSPLGNPGRVHGLCSICEERETCTFPKPEGGVWHCEEYR